MPLLGKNKVTEHHAAGAFVASTFQSARAAWPSVAEQLQPFFDQEISLPDDDVWAPFEIGMATLAVESQAIFRLLPRDQADRVTALIHRCIDSPELKGVGKMHSTITARCGEILSKQLKSLSMGSPHCFMTASD